MTKLSKAVQDRIQELRNERQLSVNKLAWLSELTQSTLDGILRNSDSCATLVSIKSICDGLDITLGEFFDTPEFDQLKGDFGN